MADVAAFRGIHYNPEAIPDLSAVVSPPYDIILPAERDRLFGRDPFNFVRIILPGTDPHMLPSDAHARAGDTWRTWQRDGILIEDSTEALYVYRQTFVSPITGQTTRRTAFVCALKLVPYEGGIVLPHEHTKPSAKADRLGLMRATAANVEPIMGLFEDSEQEVIKALTERIGGPAPMLRANVDDDVHEVWAVTDGDAIAEVRVAMADRRIWIADGHHRYETALTYSAEHPGADRIMIALIPFEDPGLVVLPTHRIISGLNPEAAERLIAELEDAFIIEDVADDDRLLDRINGMRSADGTFIMASGRSLRLMRLRDPAAMDAATPDRSPAWRALDVSILQTLVLDRALDLDPSAEVSYTRFPAEALVRARVGHASMAFIVGAPTARDLRKVTSAGDRMPPKSTYFEPKLWSGLLMRRLDDQ